MSIPPDRLTAALAVVEVPMLHADHAVSRIGRRVRYGQPDIAPQRNANRLRLAEHWLTELRPLLEGKMIV